MFCKINCRGQASRLTVNNWNIATLNLQVGDQIIWQDAEIKPEGEPAIVSPGMKDQVISLHDGFHMDLIQGGSVPPRVLVQI